MGPLHYLRLFSASGADAGDFLHGQLSADVVSLKPGEAALAAFCTPRGQVIAPILVQRRETDWLLVLDSGLATETILRMSRFVLRARVKFAALESSRVAGTTVDFADNSVLWLDRLGLGYTLTAQPATEVTADALAWKERELRHGLSWLQRETSERFLPQMLGLEEIGALSFSKGCYPGQEIIARARYLGKVKRRPVLLELEGNATLTPGSACTLSGTQNPVEGNILDSVCADGRVTTVIAIAAVSDNDQEQTGTEPQDTPAMEIEGFSSGDHIWAARRIVRVTD